MKNLPTRDEMRREDEIIREAGFVIHLRPLYGEPVWVRKGIFYSHKRALELAYRKLAGKKSREK